MEDGEHAHKTHWANTNKEKKTHGTWSNLAQLTPCNISLRRENMKYGLKQVSPFNHVYIISFEERMWNIFWNKYPHFDHVYIISFEGRIRNMFWNQRPHFDDIYIISLWRENMKYALKQMAPFWSYLHHFILERGYEICFEAIGPHLIKFTSFHYEERIWNIFWN